MKCFLPFKSRRAKSASEPNRNEPAPETGSKSLPASSSRSIPETYRERKGNLKAFRFSELRIATNNFNKLLKIGEGGFGSVYKGTITGDDGGSIVVAIKKLNKDSLQGHKEWLAEVRLLGVVDHPNLVKLVGYCSVDRERGGQRRLLVYEYMPNKSLEDHLFNRSSKVLPWKTRLDIILGAARGLAYLHEDLEVQVIFRDFKTSNVLLDVDLKPKLSDFGLAREGPIGDRSHVSTGRSKKRSVEPVPVKRKSRRPTGSAGAMTKKVLEAAIDVSKSTQKTKLKKKKEKLGTLDCPFRLTDDELDDLSEEEGKKSEEEDLGAGDARAHHEVRDNTENVHKDTEAENEGKKKIETPAKKKAPKAPVFINKILVKSIWEKGDVQLETLSPTRENPSDDVELLPRIFNYSSDEDREAPKKSEWDLEAEKLFEEMNYVQGLLNLGTSDVDMVDSEKNISSKTNKDSSCFCPDCGDQKLVLDDEIGIRCTVCSFVVQEIGNIMPDFVKHRGGRAGARDYERMDYPQKSAVELEDFTSKNFPDFENNLQVEGTVWELIPGIRDGMYPHQREGFEFIWKNISESIFIDQAKKCIEDGGGSGCIMSHAPGTGKTRLTIMFLQSYMQLNPDCCPLIIAPCSMLLTWEQEFRKWNAGLPFHNLNSPEYSSQESKNAVKLQKGDRRHGYNLETTRLVKLLSWRSEKSVLGMSYQLFEERAYINALIDNGKEKAKDIEVAGNIRKMLLNLPGILVLDEGHILRNHESHIWKALLEVRTERRIILSGTPFQNRFDELFNTFSLARPKFPDEIMPNSQGNTNENRRRITNKVREKWAKMTSNIREDDQKLNELKERIGKFVHVYKGTILKQKLPGLSVSVVVLSPTDLQNDLIEVVKTRKNSLERDHLHSLVSVHSSLFLSVVLSEKEEIIARKNDLKRLKLNPKAGVKTHFLLELIKLSWALKERVLVFGQFIHSLKLMMDILKNQFDWTEGKEILYMSGGHNEKQRQTSINLINDPESEVKVLLASSRACSEGINLVGASRVVLLDVVWNPSVTRQSISRAYIYFRLGQKKVVHVYHLIDGTWEGTKFLKQAEKVGISDLVFGSKDGAVDNPEISGEDKILPDMAQHPSMKNIFSKILYQPTESDLIDAFG